MHVVGVIPARWGSTRLPGKSLISLCGKPLVQRVLERARVANRLDRILVATDDTRIAEAVAACGGEAVMTRSDHPSGTDRVAEAVRGIAADIIVNIQGDEPLLEPSVIDDLVGRMVADPAWDMGTAATPLRDASERVDASVVKVVCGATQQALYFSRSVIPCNRDGIAEADLAPDGALYWRHVGLYAYRRAFLERLVDEPPCMLEQAEKLEQLRALYLGGRMVVVPCAAVGIGVDTPEDVVAVEAQIRELEGDA